MTRLDYSKLILKKISFDRNLLEKEYRKALNLLGMNEGPNLRDWFKSEFDLQAHQFMETRNNQLKL